MIGTADGQPSGDGNGDGWYRRGIDDCDEWEEEGIVKKIGLVIESIC